MPESVYNLQIFQGIDQHIVTEILQSAQERVYKAGEILMVEGEKSNREGYIIKQGNVEISIGGQKVAEIGVGDIVGEIALLNEETRTATVTALSDCDMIVLTIEHLIEMLNNDGNHINKKILKRIEENLER